MPEKITCAVFGCNLPIVFDIIHGGVYAKWVHEDHKCECGHQHEPITNHEAKAPDKWCDSCGQTAEECRNGNSPYGYRCSRF